MMNKNLAKCVARWLNLNNELRKVNKYLYESTELFERKYEQDYNEELFRFFAGKITRFSNDENKLYKILNAEETKEVNLERIL